MTAGSRKNGNRLRIIGGEWRSRLITFQDAPGLRPTPDRVRETLFNWLQLRITGAFCLDLFAGSGVLGFEALSRGASRVVALEQDAVAIRNIKQNAENLQTEKLELIRRDALTWLQDAPVTPFDIVFIDPPFASGLYPEACRLLAERGWLGANALIYIEAAEPSQSLSLPDSWQPLKEKRAGDVCYALYSYSKHQ